MTNTKSSDGGRLIVLDGLRGWAAALVALMHFPLDELTHSIPLIANGYLFVDMFFVLSGFVIAYVYSEQFSTVAFLRARGARLLPLYFATLIVGVGLEFVKLSGFFGHDGGFKPPNSVEGLLHEVFLVHVLWWVPNTSYNPPNWSVAVEIYAYFIFALGCLFRRRLLLSTLIIVSIPSAFAIYNQGVLNDAHLLAVPRGLSGFAVGVFVYTAWGRLGGRGDLPFVADLSLLGIILYVWFGGSLVLQPAMLFGLMVLGILLGADKILMARFLRGHFSLWLGKISFTLYMVHYFIAMRFDEIGEMLGRSIANDMVYLFIYCILALALSNVIFKYFEWPMRSYLRGKAQ